MVQLRAAPQRRVLDSQWNRTVEGMNSEYPTVRCLEFVRCVCLEFVWCVCVEFVQFRHFWNGDGILRGLVVLVGICVVCFGG